MAERTKLADRLVNDDGTLSIAIFGDPDTNGKQTVVETLTINPADFPPAVVTKLAAAGFGFYAAARYSRTDEDVSVAVADLARSMREGTWSPGRPAGQAEPSPFHEALANLTGVPVSVVEHDIAENKAKWTKSYTKLVRNDPRVASEVAKIVKARAERDAGRARAALKGAKPGLDLGGIFGGSGEGAQESAAA